MTQVKAGGREIAIRPLTRKEIKALRKDHDIELGALRRDNAEEALDLVLDLVLKKKDVEFLDSQPNPEALSVFKAIMDATFGRADEAKN